MNHPRWARPIFVGYALLLVTGTHWPRLTIAEGPIPRPDLFIHIAAFGLWTALLARCGFFGPWRTGRNITISALVAAVYAVVDETTQGLPGINRTVAIEDGLANLGGVIVGSIAAVMLARHAKQTMRRQDDADRSPNNAAHDD